VKVPGYTDLEEIGRGGYAVVYRGHQAAFGRSVAIKVLTSPSVGELEKTRFEREALAMGRLSWHPNIVVVHETGMTDTGLPYLVEEFLEGGSLGDKLRRDGIFSPAEAVADLIQLCAAAHTAHEADLLHRDIKPDNALIDAFGHIKLADFGIAAVSGSTITATGIVTATIAHAAPEVLNGARATYGADVYSLGSTLYELLTGTAAFVRDDEESIVPLVVRVTNDPVPDLTQLGVPSPVADVVEQAMAKSPDDRPSSALQLGQMLQSAQQQLGLRVTDLSVRGKTTSRHDDTIVGDAPVPVVALTPPPAPTAPPMPAPAAAPAPAATSESPVVAQLNGATGTVAVPPSSVTPPPARPRDPPTAPDDESSSSTLLIVLVAVVVLLVLAIAYTLVTRGDDGDSGGRTTTGDTGTDPADTQTITTGDRPFRVAVGDDAAWVTNSRETTVDQIDLETNDVVNSIDIGGEPAGVDVNGAGVWAANYETGQVARIDPDSGEVTPIDVEAGPRNVAATETSVWTANLDANSVSHINVTSGFVEANIQVPAGPRGIVATDDQVWVTSQDDGSVTVIDPVGNRILRTIETGGRPGGIVLAGGKAWVADGSQDVVIPIDSTTYEIGEPIPVGGDPGGMAASDSTVYVSNSADDTVSVIDAESGEVTGRIDTGDAPGGLAVTDTDLWVANSEDDTVDRIPLA
jgi:YVTN family beta-propeller protein